MRLVEHAADGRDAGHVLDQEAPEALSRRVDAGGVVQTTNERQEFRKIELHLRPASRLEGRTDGSVLDEHFRRGLTAAGGFSVSAAPTTGRGTRGESAVKVTRPLASGLNVPAVAGRPSVRSQSW